jgi:hypothetical protein
MLFCTYVTQVYEIAKTLKLMHGILYVCHTSLWDYQNKRILNKILLRAVANITIAPLPTRNIQITRKNWALVIAVFGSDKNHICKKWFEGSCLSENCEWSHNILNKQTKRLLQIFKIDTNQPNDVILANYREIYPHKKFLWFFVQVFSSHDSSPIMCFAQTWGYRQDSREWSISRLYFIQGTATNLMFFLLEIK